MGPTAPDNGIDVFLARVDGTLGAPIHYDGADGSGIAIGDLDGDGFPDVVATSGTTVNVFMNRRDGTLSFPLAYGTGHYVGGLALGDVNGDGALDLVLGEMTSGAEVRLNDGAGVLAKSVALPVSQGGAYGGVAVVDLNGDGLADVAMSNDSASIAVGTGWTVLLTNPDGGFEASSYPGSEGSIAVVDRGDCPPDLATVSDDGRAISVFQNRGDGHFAQAVSYALPTAGATYIISGDFNGDCLPDLAVSTSFTTNPGNSCDHVEGSAWVLYGKSDLTFGGPVSIATGGKVPLGLALLGPVQAPRDLAFAAWCGTGITVLGGPSKH
jgi:hypothetical protein